MLTNFITAQPNYTIAKEQITKMYDDSNFLKINRIYIVQLSFCNGSKYCGDNMYKYLLNISKKKQIHIITPDTGSVYINNLIILNHVTVSYISRKNLYQTGLFSVYQYYITRKKIKFLK